MRKVILFIAMSLDGYIADCEGNVDWLMGEEKNQNDMQSYQQFIQGIDTVIMGWTTYHQIITQLSPDKWLYENLKCYVLTHRKLESNDHATFIDGDVSKFVHQLKQESGKDIWICGGAQIIQQLLREKAIDQFHISIIPTLLGNGIPLFTQMEQHIQLHFLKSETYNGITDLIYELK